MHPAVLQYMTGHASAARATARNIPQHGLCLLAAVGIACALISVASYGATAADYEACLPLRALETPLPGTYTVDEMVTLRTALVVAQRSGAPVLKDFGVARLSESYRRCVMTKVPAPQAKILDEALRYQRKVKEQAAVSLGIDFVAPSVAGMVISSIADSVYDSSRAEIQKALQASIVAAWRRDRNLDPVRVVDELINQVSVIPGVVLNEDSRNALKIAAFDVLQDRYGSSSGNLEVRMRQSIDGDADTRPESIENHLSLSSSEQSRLAVAVAGANRSYLDIRALQNAMTDFTENAARASEAATRAQRDSSDSAVRAGLTAWLKEHPEVSSSPEAMLVAAAAMKQQGKHTQLNEAGIQALESEATFRMSARDVRDGASTTAAAFSTLRSAAHLVGNEGAARWAEAGVTVASTVSSVAGRMVEGSLGPIGWISVAGSVLQMGGSLGGIFGGSSSGAEAARYATMMKALRDISMQLSELRDLVIELDARQMHQLRLQSTYMELLLARQADAIEAKGFGACSEFVNVLHQSGVVTLAQAMAVFRDSAMSTRPALLRECSAYAGKYGSTTLTRIERGKAELNSWFWATAAQIDDQLATIGNLTDADRGNLLASNKARSSTHAALLQLTEAAGVRSSSLLWPSLMRPLRSWKEVDSELDALSTTDLRHPDLGRRASALGRIGLASFQIRDALNNPVDYPRAMTALHSVSVLSNIAELLDATAPRGVIDAATAATTNPQILYGRRVAADTWLSAWSPLAMVTMASATLERGDYSVPLIEALLAHDAVPGQPACTKNAPGPRDIVPVRDLCARFGAKSLRQYIDDAKLVVRYLPALRANVVAYRVRRMLDKHADNIGHPSIERPDGTRYEPRYEHAFYSSWPVSMERLLPGEQLRHLSSSANSAYVAPGEADARWFIRLSGKCSGITERALNARAVCTGLECGGASLTQDADGKWIFTKPDDENPEPERKKERLAWQARQRDICVMAPLPTPQRVELSASLGGAATERAIRVAAEFLTQASYYKVLSELPIEEKMRMMTFLKPSGVGLWKPTLGPAPTGAAE